MGKDKGDAPCWYGATPTAFSFSVVFVVRRVLIIRRVFVRRKPEPAAGHELARVSEPIIEKLAATFVRLAVYYRRQIS